MDLPFLTTGNPFIGLVSNINSEIIGLRNDERNDRGSLSCVRQTENAQLYPDKWQEIGKRFNDCFVPAQEVFGHKHGNMLRIGPLHALSRPVVQTPKAMVDVHLAHDRRPGIGRLLTSRMRSDFPD